MPAHIQPTAPIAPDALLPSDPGDAMRIAQDLLGTPRMSNHSHGLWGYGGRTAAARPLTVQSTGIGGPSAAIVLRELTQLGVRRAVRIGACAALQPTLARGDVLVATRALAADGTSAALGARGSVSADPALSAALRDAAGPGARPGTVVSTDPFDAGDHGPAGALAVDLESAAVLALGAGLGIAVAALLVVGSPPAEVTMTELGGIAAAALAAPQRSPRSGNVIRA